MNKGNGKVKKTIAKIGEPPENGARKAVFLTEVDFNVAHYALGDFIVYILTETCETI